QLGGERGLARTPGTLDSDPWPTRRQRTQVWPGATQACHSDQVTRALNKDRLGALHKLLERHVEAGEVPGLAALVACGDDVHVEAIGRKAFGDAESIGRDAIFRIASITKPI